MVFKKSTDGPPDGSNFNEAGFQISRLHNSWTHCYTFRVNADFIHWRWELEYIWSELSSDARRLHNVTWSRNQYNILVCGLDKLIQIAVNNKDGQLLYKCLDRKEKLLKKLQDDSGKGGSYKDSGDEEFF